MHDAMKALPPSERDNVVIAMPNGRFIGSRPGLAEKAYVPRPIPGVPNGFTDDKGNKFFVPRAEPRTAILERFGTRMLAFNPLNRMLDAQNVATMYPPDRTGGGTGALYRIFSTLGYSYVTADVDVPCYSGQLDPSYETGNVYLGGWGANTSAVDAGLVHSSAFDGSANDNYALLFKESSAGETTTVSITGRWGCGQTIGLKFFADGNYYIDPSGAKYNDIAESITGYDTSFTTYNTLTYIIHVPTGEWNYGGTNNFVKRMTTIAQTPAQATPNNGDYFGYVPTDASPAPLFHWANSTIGNYGSGNTWLPQSSGGYQLFAGFLNTSTEATASGRVFVTPITDDSVEDTGIYLAPGNT